MAMASPRTRPWRPPSGSATSLICAPGSFLVGENCNFRLKKGVPDCSPSRRPIPPVWIWIVWPPPWGQSRRSVAAAAGAASLSVIFGVQHVAAVLLIVASAAVGAVLRRTLAKYSTNPLLQPFCAALLAGIIGALAVRYHLSSSLRLVAVCPCMILMPGPHILNGALDLINGRI